MGTFSGIDELYKGFGEAINKMGAATYEAILKSFEGTYEYYRSQVWNLRYDLSYMPKNPRLKPEEVKFLHYNFLYFNAGMDMKAETLAKKFKALYESKNIPDEYRLWVGDVGTDVPVYCIVSYGKDEVDFYAQRKKNQELLGEEAKVLNLKALPLIRKVDIKTGMPRPDLLPPSKKE